MTYRHLVTKMGFLDILKEFAGETTIHGLAYMAQPKQSVFRKLTWALLFVIFLIYSTVQLKTAVDCKSTYLFFGRLDLFNGTLISECIINHCKFELSLLKENFWVLTLLKVWGIDNMIFWDM